MALRTRNLNLIPLLQALLEEESVAGAARKMNLSQPAMSGALARLREALNDPLLLRQGRSMRLSPRAEELRARVNRLCAEIEDLFEPVAFDPATAEHKFVVATPDYLAYMISKELLPRLAGEAPRIKLRFVDVPVDLPEWLKNGDIDLAVCGNFGTWPELEYQPIFKDPVVAAMSSNHPLSEDQQLSMEQLLKYPFLAFDPSIGRFKHQRRVQTGIASFDLAPQVTIGQITDAVLLTLGTSFVTAAPKSLVEAMSRSLPLRQLDLAGDDPPIDTGMFWMKALGEGPAIEWLRNVLRESLAQFAPISE
ncbi:MAG: LysR family transcriptional regulator [Gammaproteobacteria bacterium]|nr:LysR family transcriptional regulator [Gammaproteobacteria bacterium]MDD9963350.1 LysR family transcriptional regulator [Gammaproteobacteria bacterium]MDE0272487.1 LysR family transcriptional regulator [Gammaproteobacteria bacterium]